MASITVDEVKEKKIELEKEIFDLVKAFEKDFGMEISYIDMFRSRPDEEVALDEPPRRRKLEPLKTVVAHVNFMI